MMLFLHICMHDVKKSVTVTKEWRFVTVLNAVLLFFHFF